MTTKEKAERFIACAVEKYIDKTTGEERRRYHECGVVWARKKVIQIKLNTTPIGGELVCFLPRDKPKAEKEDTVERGQRVNRRG